MKGIILAGGSGTRLSPITRVISKQLVPVYDKPMIYYPLSILLLTGIREVLIITTPEDVGLFQRLLGDGSRIGVQFSYQTQSAPRGIAEALLIGEEHCAGEPVTLVLGDNIFFGAGLAAHLQRAAAQPSGCVLFGYQVRDPERYGVVEFDTRGELLGIEEKPAQPKSDVAVTGLYMYDGQAARMARALRPSARGELEITDLNRAYIEAGRARLEMLGRGTAWLDTGTFESLLEAAEFVRVLEHRQGIHVACIEEIAYRMGFIDAAQLRLLAAEIPNSSYGQYLARVAAAPPSAGHSVLP